MNAETEKKIETLTKYIEGKLSVKLTAQMLNLSERTVYRKVALLKDGVNPFWHGNTGRVSKRKLDPATKVLILKLIIEKYYDLPYILIARYLEKEEKITVSEETVRRIVVQAEQTEQHKIKINPHPLRRRRPAFGELIQIDGSPHHWFGNDKPPVTLLAFIDDATGRITAARFEESENSAGYRRLIYEHVRQYGIPVAFYSDQHSVFKDVGEDPALARNVTQYQRICARLGIEPIYALSPQAKGRIERLNRTLQHRWPGVSFAQSGTRERYLKQKTSLGKASLFSLTCLKKTKCSSGNKPLSFYTTTEQWKST